MRLRKCCASKADGTPCGAPEHLVELKTGLCPAHAPGAAERMGERGRKGAEASTRKLKSPGLGSDVHPPLKTHGDAQSWLETIGRAVSTGRLSDRQAQAAQALGRL